MLSGCGRSKTAVLSRRRCFEAIRRHPRGLFRESRAYILALAPAKWYSEPRGGRDCCSPSYLIGFAAKVEAKAGLAAGLSLLNHATSKRQLIHKYPDKKLAPEANAGKPHCLAA